MTTEKIVKPYRIYKRDGKYYIKKNGKEKRVKDLRKVHVRVIKKKKVIKPKNRYNFNKLIHNAIKLGLKKYETIPKSNTPDFISQIAQLNKILEKEKDEKDNIENALKRARQSGSVFDIEPYLEKGELRDTFNNLLARYENDPEYKDNKTAARERTIAEFKDIYKDELNKLKDEINNKDKIIQRSEAKIIRNENKIALLKENKNELKRVNYEIYSKNKVAASGDYIQNLLDHYNSVEDLSALHFLKGKEKKKISIKSMKAKIPKKNALIKIKEFAINTGKDPEKVLKDVFDIEPEEEYNKGKYDPVSEESGSDLGGTGYITDEDASKNPLAKHALKENEVIPGRVDEDDDLLGEGMVSDGLTDRQVNLILGQINPKRTKFVGVYDAKEVIEFLNNTKSDNFCLIYNTVARGTGEIGHWKVINANRNDVELFDSLCTPLGNDIKNTIIKLMKRNYEIIPDLIHNTTKIQPDESPDCGWYCITFLIIRRLFKQDFHDASNFSKDEQDKNIKYPSY